MTKNEVSATLTPLTDARRDYITRLMQLTADWIDVINAKIVSDTFNGDINEAVRLKKILDNEKQFYNNLRHALIMNADVLL